MDNETPREQLRAWRLRKDWSLERAAAHFGFSPNHLSNIETGKRLGGPRILRAIKKKTRIDLLGE